MRFTVLKFDSSLSLDGLQEEPCEAGACAGDGQRAGGQPQQWCQDPQDIANVPAPSLQLTAAEGVCRVGSIRQMPSLGRRGTGTNVPSFSPVPAVGLSTDLALIGPRLPLRYQKVAILETAIKGSESINYGFQTTDPQKAKLF